MTQLSEHFTLDEMLRSDTATEKGITEQYTPPQDVINNLSYLCLQVLEPLRIKISAALGTDTPIIITSGYRCPRLNQAIGGANNSQHELGQAADTHVNGMSIEQWYQFIKGSGVNYDQLIQEFGKWAHVSCKPNGAPRKENLRATVVDGQTVYTSDN